MKKFKFFIGTDISKKVLDFVLMEEEKIISFFKISNSPEAIKMFLKDLGNIPGFDFEHALFCMETTGIYSHHLTEILYEKKIATWLEAALRIKRCLGLTRGKNDKLDAKRIGEFAWIFRHKVNLWTPSRKEIQTLKNLLTSRSSLISAKLSLQAHGKEAESFSKSQKEEIDRHKKGPLTALNKSIKAIEADIRKLLNSDPELKKKAKLIQSVDGVGPIITAHVLASTNEFKKFDDPRKYACHCGVVPFEYSSGSSIRGKSRVSKMADRQLKTLLNLGAMSAIGCKGEFQDYYQRKVNSGKNKMSVLNAIRNKIIHRIFACVRDERFYSKNYVKGVA